MSDEPGINALLVEDDERLARFTATYLREHGIEVTCCADGEQGLHEAVRGRYDVVLLDLMLPRKSGIQVCLALREQSDVPVIVLTARSEEADRVLGLEVGADDYLVKPFSPRELVARVNAVVRRYRGLAGPVHKPIQVGRLTVHPVSMRATLDGRDLNLTAYEFALLRVLAERRGHVLTREQLLDLAKGTAEDSFDRSIDVRISRLRQKLGDDPKRPSLLKTVRGIGYVLSAEDEP